MAPSVSGHWRQSGDILPIYFAQDGEGHIEGDQDGATVYKVYQLRRDAGVEIHSSMGKTAMGFVVRGLLVYKVHSLRLQSKMPVAMVTTSSLGVPKRKTGKSLSS